MRQYRRDTLKRHIHDVHTNQRQHVCPVCGKSYKRRSHVKSHIMLVHRSTLETAGDVEADFAVSNPPHAPGGGGSGFPESMSNLPTWHRPAAT